MMHSFRIAVLAVASSVAAFGIAQSPNPQQGGTTPRNGTDSNNPGAGSTHATPGARQQNRGGSRSRNGSVLNNDSPLENGTMRNNTLSPDGGTLQRDRTAPVRPSTPGDPTVPNTVNPNSGTPNGSVVPR